MCHIVDSLLYTSTVPSHILRLRQHVVSHAGQAQSQQAFHQDWDDHGIQLPQQRLADSLRRDIDDNLTEMDWTERVTDSQTDMVTSQPTTSEQTR